MAFEIEVNVGDEGKLWLRGCSDGTIELCKKVMLPATKEAPAKEGLSAFKFFANPVQAFERILKMRVASCDAKTLGELVEAIKTLRKEIKAELSTVM